MKIIQTNNALKPAGHYSQAIEHDGTIYVSGQLAIDADSGEKVYGPIADQMNVILKNIHLILEEAGSNMQQVLKVSIYVSDISHWLEINSVYEEYFGDHKPARIVVPTGPLHYGLSVEVDCIAYL